jgi:hypothetical protein
MQHDWIMHKGVRINRLQIKEKEKYRATRRQNYILREQLILQSLSESQSHQNKKQHKKNNKYQKEHLNEYQIIQQTLLNFL